MRVTSDTADEPPLSQAASAARWHGWYRPRRAARFVKLAEAADYTTCWSLLLDRLHEQGSRGGDSVVLRAAEDANRSATARRPATTSC